ncbi:hypothetical protein Tco_0176781 [Tanacetum coccineum]
MQHSMTLLRHLWIAKTGKSSLKQRPNLIRDAPNQDPSLTPPKDSDENKKKLYDFDAFASKQPQAQTSSAWKTSNTREAPFSSSKQKTSPQSE